MIEEIVRWMVIRRKCDLSPNCDKQVACRCGALILKVRHYVTVTAGFVSHECQQGYAHEANPSCFYSSTPLASMPPRKQSKPSQPSFGLMKLINFAPQLKLSYATRSSPVEHAEVRTIEQVGGAPQRKLTAHIHCQK
jgi:hypothetical protein